MCLRFVLTFRAQKKLTEELYNEKSVTRKSSESEFCCGWLSYVRERERTTYKWWYTERDICNVICEGQKGWKTVYKDM